MNTYTKTIQTKEKILIQQNKTRTFYKPNQTEAILNYRMSLDGKDKIETINNYDINTFEIIDNSIIIPIQSHELIFKFKKEYLKTCEKKYIKKHWQEQSCKCCVELVERISENPKDIHHIVEIPYIWIDLLYMPKIITKKPNNRLKVVV